MAKSTSPSTPAAADQAPKLYALKIARMVVTVRGTSPLLVNRFPEDAIATIEQSQQGAAKTKKAPRDPEKEWMNSRYVDHLGRDCLPAACFKESLVRAVSFIDGMAMTEARGAFFVDGDSIPLRASDPYKHKARVVLNRKTTSIAYRACYDTWECDLPISYQENVITVEQLLNIIELAGFAVGVGAWRPQCRGQFGRFEVLKSSDRASLGKATLG
jgi:hypothetical protein